MCDNLQYLEICLKCFSYQYTTEIHQNNICCCGSELSYYDHPELLTIIHADMDAFFASVEILDNPSLKDQPVIIGGDPKSRSVVSTCSYVARKFGIHSAMPMYKAYKLCPDGVFLPPRMERYLEISRQVFKIFESFTPDFEPLSIDEAFLDMKGTSHLTGHPVYAALMLKDRIKREIGVSVSVGVAPNKFLAKLASDENKPDGIFVVSLNNSTKYLEQLKIERMWGIGKASLPLMKSNNIYTIKDLKNSSKQKLKKLFGNNWLRFYNFSRGRDIRKVEREHVVKSMGSELTLEKDISIKEEMLVVIWHECQKLSRRLFLNNAKGKTVTLKVKTSSFVSFTRSKTLKKNLYADIDIYNVVKILLSKLDLSGAKVRLLGVYISNFEDNNAQMELPLLGEDDLKDEKKKRVNKAVNLLKDKYGDLAVNWLID